MLDGVEAGFFDTATLEFSADRQAKRISMQDQDTSFSDAWARVRNSFDDDQAHVIPALAEAIKSNVWAVSPLNLNGTVRFLKDFGFTAEAKEALDFYIENRVEEPSFWDLSNNPFMDKIDPDVEAAFSKKMTETKPQVSLLDILNHLANKDGWNNKDIDYLSGVTKEAYYKLFKELKGTALSVALKGALTFRNISNADDKMKKLTATVEAALSQIASESKLNAWRVDTRLRRG